MKVLEKTAELGALKFKVQTNRDIAVKSFEEFPDVIKYLVDRQGKVSTDNKEFLKSHPALKDLDAIKNKELGVLFDINDKIAQLIEFALPLMLESAKETIAAREILDYAKENGALEIFNSKMLEFLAQGFTQREQEKPKIQFSMK